MEANGSAYIGIATPTLMYITISARPLFDAINLPLETYPKVHVKAGDLGDIHVIIQYWLPEAKEMETK